MEVKQWNCNNVSKELIQAAKDVNQYDAFLLETPIYQLDITLKNSYEEFAHSLYKLWNYEQSIYVMTYSPTDFKTDDKMLISHIFRTNLHLIPIKQQNNLIFSLNLDNKTDKSIPILSKHLKSKVADVMENTFILGHLAPGCSLSIDRIYVTKYVSDNSLHTMPGKMTYIVDGKSFKLSVRLKLNKPKYVLLNLITTRIESLTAIIKSLEEIKSNNNFSNNLITYESLTKTKFDLLIKYSDKITNLIIKSMLLISPTMKSVIVRNQVDRTINITIDHEDNVGIVIEALKKIIKEYTNVIEYPDFKMIN